MVSPEERAVGQVTVQLGAIGQRGGAECVEGLDRYPAGVVRSPQQVTARRSRPPTLWGFLSRLYATAGWSSLTWLHRITAPTLVISGGKDPTIPPAKARILGARLPHATVHVVADAGHLLLMDRAADCARLISDFLRGEPAARDS